MIRRSVSIGEPASEPVTLSEAKKHLEIADSDTTHDTHVTALISAARQQWEHDTQRITSVRTVIEVLEEWPGQSSNSTESVNYGCAYSGAYTSTNFEACNFRFLVRPIIGINQITYFDANGTSQAFTDSDYSLDVPNRRLELQPGSTWPTVQSRWDAISISYQAGQSQVQEIEKAAIKLQIDVLFELRGLTPNKDATIKAYEALAQRYQRASYP